tara:strand:- start:874 stop:1104 length:231 start_codon:yes stop_codon:yes gene_type:complete
MDYVCIATLNHFDSHRISIVLEKNKIDFFFKSPYESSLQSGWMVPGSSFNEKLLFVDQSQSKKTQKLLEKYIIDWS